MEKKRKNSKASLFRSIIKLASGILSNSTLMSELSKQCDHDVDKTIDTVTYLAMNQAKSITQQLNNTTTPGKN